MDDFYHSLFDHKLFVKLPDRGDDNLTAATKLLEKRREMSEVEQALVAQKDEYQLKMENLQRRREDLERKEYQLKDSLLKFDKFVKDNDAKKQRAVKRQNDERDSRLTKEKEIDYLKARITELNARKEHIAKKAEKYSKFQSFLEKTVDASTEFQEIREIMGRYDTLFATHESLLASDQENQVKMQEERQELNQFVAEQLNEKLHSTARLSELQDRLDALESECLRLETNWLKIQSSAAAKTLELGRIKMATYNLFQRAQEANAEHRQDVRHREEKDTCGQLTDVQQCMLNLEDISSQTKELIFEDFQQRYSSRRQSSMQQDQSSVRRASKQERT